VVRRQLWVVTKEYDVEKLKVNIVSVETREDFIAKYGNAFGRSTDMIEAIDALDAWKKAREMHNERD
jgi:hypothetical protein